MKKILKFMSVALVSSFLMSVGGNSVFATDLEPNNYNPNNNNQENGNKQDDVKALFRKMMFLQGVSFIQQVTHLFCTTFDDYCVSKGWNLSNDDTNSEQIDYFIDQLKKIDEEYGREAEEAVRTNRSLGNRIVLKRYTMERGRKSMDMLIYRNTSSDFQLDKIFSPFFALSKSYGLLNLV